MKTVSLAQSRGALHNPKGDASMSEHNRQLREASRMFTGFFLGQLLKGMRDTVKQGDLGHGGMGEKFFQAEADQTMAMEAAKGEGYGLTELIYRSLQQRNGMHMKDLPGDVRRVRAYADAAQYDANGIAHDAQPMGVGR